MDYSLNNIVGKLQEIVPDDELLKYTSNNVVSSLKSGAQSITGVIDKASSALPVSLQPIASKVSGTVKKLTGFADPTGTSPTVYREGESDWHLLTGRLPGKTAAQQETHSQASIILQPQTSYDKTHCQTREESRAGVLVPIVSAGGIPWQEPKSDKATEYGQSWVVATPGGVTMEMDSTLGSQAWRVTHPSNSYMEINGKGDFIQKTFAERYDIIAKGHKTFINASRDTTVQADETLMVFGKTTIKRMLSKSEWVVLDNDLKVGGNNTVSVIGNELHNIGGSVSNIIANDVSSVIGGDVTTIAANVTLTASTIITVNAGRAIRMQAGVIYLN